MSDFAKLIRTADGEQVLFQKGTSEEGAPCLFQKTEIDGMSVEMNMSFKEGGWDALDAAFDKVDAVQAETVRRSIAKMLVPVNT